MASEQEILASSQYWLTGWGLTMPLVTGALEISHLAHVQGLYAGLTYSTGVVVVAADVGTIKPLWRGGVRRR